MAEKRYYYKAKDGKGYLNFKSPLSKEKLKEYVEITKEQFDSETYVAPHVPTAAEIARQKKLSEIAQLKHELAETDYVVIKIAESDDTDEQAALRETYSDIIAARKTKRARVDQLLSELD